MKLVNHQMKIGLIIPASGTGRRMQTKEKKQFLKIGNKELLELTLENINAYYTFDQIVVVCQKEDFNHIETLVGNVKSINHKMTNISIVEGGATRQNSVYNGLQAIQSGITHVLIHDGARPFVNEDSINRIINALQENPNVTLALPAIDSLCEVENEMVTKNIDRSKIYNVQTPQGFDKNILLESHEKALSMAYQGTDDCSLCQNNGYPTVIVRGNDENIKITRPLDMMIAEVIYKNKAK